MCRFVIEAIMKQEQKKRLYSLLKNTAIYLSIGIAYLIFSKLTNIGIPCAFHLITGLHCTGCGISRMFMALASLDIASAFNANALLLCLLPFALILFIYKSIQYIKTGSAHDNKFLKACYIIVFVLCVAFTIMRNTQAYSFLAPH